MGANVFLHLKIILLSYISAILIDDVLAFFW